jgi:hypothetical protein
MSKKNKKDNMEFSKYIVPIYAGNEYRGNGFIVNGFLVMPYHLIKIGPNSQEVYDSFYYHYQGKAYREHLVNSIVNQGDKKDISNNPNLARDLLVFRTNIINSNLVISSEYNIYEDCIYYGYNEEDKSLTTIIKAMGEIHQQKVVSKVNERPVEIGNCMTCICKLRPGNSGGIVCQGDKIIGMFIKDQSFESGAFQSVFIKASYIMQVIEDKVGRF